MISPGEISRSQGQDRMRKFFGPISTVSRVTVESQALEGNLLSDPSVHLVDVYVPAGHDGQGLPLLVDLVGEHAGSDPQRPWQIDGHRFVTISAATCGNPICIRLWRQGLGQTGEARAWSGRRPQISRRSF